MRYLLALFALVAFVISNFAFTGQSPVLSSVLSPVLNTIAQLQWQNRVLIIWSDQAKVEFDGFIEAYQLEIDDRDMVLFVIDQDNQVFSNYSGNIDSNLATSLKSNFPQQQARYFLIGKDGGIKSYGNKLAIEKIFAEINLMPMRRQEMRNRHQH